jgi:hypothetical protein
MKSLVVVLLTILPFLSAAQSPDDQSTPSSGVVTFTWVERIGDANARSFFVFATSVRHFTIRHDGQGESYGSTLMRKKFNLRVGQQERLQRLYFLEQDGDLILAYEVSDGLSGWGYIERVNQKTLKLLWVTPVSGFNIGRGLVESEDLYLSASNLLAKVDLHSGNYVWQVNDIGEPVGEFTVPRLMPDRVVFREDRGHGRTIEVDKVSGRVLNSP